jgi:hypothetical protein
MTFTCRVKSAGQTDQTETAAVYSYSKLIHLFWEKVQLLVESQIVLEFFTGPLFVHLLVIHYLFSDFCVLSAIAITTPSPSQPLNRRVTMYLLVSPVRSDVK